MSIGDSITLVSCLAGLTLALPGLMIFLNMLFSHTSERAVRRLSQGAITPFFVGLASIGIVGYIGSSMMAMGSLFQFVGAILMLILLGWMFGGLGVVARLIGSTLGQAVPHTGNSVTDNVIGAFALTLAIAFPLVGWFLVLPLSWIVGSGAQLLSLVNRRSGSTTQRAAPDASFTPQFTTGD